MNGCGIAVHPLTPCSEHITENSTPPFLMIKGLP